MSSLNLLRRLIAIPSPFPDETKIAKFLSRYLVNLGFRVKEVKTNYSRKNLIATLGNAKRYLGFYGHMDTVPPDKNYQSSPFLVTVKENIAYGLGVSDMKGGIVAILQLAQHASKNNLSVKLVFGVDEENISKGAHDLVRSDLLNDLDFLISGESGQITDLDQPFSVVLGRKGRVSLNIEVLGKKAHAAERVKGINAIEQAGELISVIKKIKLPKDKKLGSSDIIFQEINSGTDSFSIPDHCLIKCSVLTNSSTTRDDVIHRISESAKELGINVKISLSPRETPYGESYIIDTNNRLMKEIEQKILKPNRVKPIYTPSVADENVFANFLKIPVLALGPIGGNEHVSGEWLDLSSLQKVEITYNAILDLYHGLQDKVEYA